MGRWGEIPRFPSLDDNAVSCQDRDRVAQRSTVGSCRCEKIRVIVLVARHYRHHLPWFEDGWDLALLVLIGILLAVYMFARWLKKTVRVTE
jgi:hypothetical protein